MAVYGCPKGHQSTEPDFCSECGSRIQGAPSSASRTESVSAIGSGVPCPDCGAPRADTSSNFCEVCGYNYATGTHGNVPGEAPPIPGPLPPPPQEPPEPEPVPIVPAEPEPSTHVQHWTLIVAVDPSLREPDSPEPPANVAPVTVELDKPISLIGRTSEKRGIHPEVSLDIDDAVSHRHALLTRGDDGSMILRDVGSANGTRVNGSDVKALDDVALHVGDQITLGRWTRLTVKAV